MSDSVFHGIFDTTMTATIPLSNFLLYVACALVAGLIVALAYRVHTRYTKSFVATLAMLPAVVCVIIMMVNDNVGTGVAVAGAFSLVRFRSVPGTAKEIGALFLAMGAGLMTGMGYLAFALLFTGILSAVMVLYAYLDFGADSHTDKYRTLHITIPEDLDYTTMFDDLFARYTSACRLTNVKTTNMGSLFKLTYDLTLQDIEKEKELIDSLRCRNGNLEISMSHQETTQSGL